MDYFIEDIDGLEIYCPNCKKTLTELAFFDVAFDNYKKHNKLLKLIQCEPNGCNFEGDLIDWIGFVKEF